MTRKQMINKLLKFNDKLIKLQNQAIELANQIDAEIYDVNFNDCGQTLMELGNFDLIDHIPEK